MVGRNQPDCQGSPLVVDDCAGSRPSCVQRLIQHIEQEVRVGVRDAHGRSKTDGLPPQAALPEQKSPHARVLKHLRTFDFSRLFRRAIFDQLDAEQETASAHVTDQRVLLLQFLKSGKKIAAKSHGVFLQLLLLDYLQHSLADGGGNRIPAKSIEVNSLGQHTSNLWSRDDRGERAPVADPFGHRHDIGNNPLLFESPKMAAGPAKTRLDFVSYANAARSADVFISFLGDSRPETPHIRQRLGSIQR